MPGVATSPPQQITRRKFLIAGGAAAAGLALYSGEIARHEIDIVPAPSTSTISPPLFTASESPNSATFTWTSSPSPSSSSASSSKVNALAPDLVLLTGDFITHGSLTFVAGGHAIHRCAEILTTLTAPHRYAILGNHDVAFNAKAVTRALATYGTPVLINQYVPIERNGARLWLSGLDDPGTSNPDLNLAVPAKPDGPVLLMAHEPDFADDVIAHPRGPLVDLMLAGHSHGGQIRLPLLGAMILPPMGRKYPEGFYQLNRMQLYVNRGIGTVGLPFRLNCPPEITLITLQTCLSK